MSPKRPWMLAIGPGILFAGAAIGVSHIVQATRAGAKYGLGLVAAVALALVFKYAAFSFGPRYAAATGTSLLEGYRRQGKWALGAYALVTLGTLFTVQAAVTIVTAGLLLSLFELPLSPTTASALILIVCAVVNGVGGYGLLDRVVKFAVLVLTLSTVVATVFVLPKVPWGSWGVFGARATSAGTEELRFVAELVGWMPSALDVAVWHSLWTLAKRRHASHVPTVRQAMFDFDLGYWGTGLLAVCFLLLGAGVAFEGNATPPGGATAFAAFFIGMYEQSLGAWTKPIIGGAAALVMLSTTVTVLDGFPRAIAVLMRRFREPESDGGDALSERTGVYPIAMVVLALGALAVIAWFRGQLGTLVTVATTLSFLTAPVFAILNHRAVFASEVAVEHQPGRGMRWLSLVSAFALVVIAVFYVAVRFLGLGGGGT